MRIAVTGSSGLIGSTLIPFLLQEQRQVTQISRQSSVLKGPSTPLITWDPERGQMDVSQLEGFDVIIHLAGANVGERWEGGYKQKILESRKQGTRLLCQSLAQLKQKPQLLLSASAMGYYGNHAPEVLLDEQSPLGQGFLPKVCTVWEDETKAAQAAGIRVVNMRFGVVLSKRGGALAKMWLPFQLGLGGILGSGRQAMSWVALDEIPYIIEFLINNKQISGPVNVVSTQSVSNKEFTKVLGQVIKRPTIFPVPAIAVRLLFGEMGQELLLEGATVRPKRLQENGYSFKYADLKTALEKAVR